MPICMQGWERRASRSMLEEKKLKKFVFSQLHKSRFEKTFLTASVPMVWKIRFKTILPNFLYKNLCTYIFKICNTAALRFFLMFLHANYVIPASSALLYISSWIKIFANLSQVWYLVKAFMLYWAGFSYFFGKISMFLYGTGLLSNKFLINHVEGRVSWYAAVCECVLEISLWITTRSSTKQGFPSSPRYWKSLQYSTC